MQLTLSSCVRIATVVQLLAATTTAVRLIVAATTAVLLCQLLYSCSSRLKFQTFFFLLKTKNPLKKSLTLPKIFPYLLIFPSTNSNLVTYLALYIEDQAINTTHPFTPSNNYFLILNILKFHHFTTHKHISISFSISLRKSLLLERNITHYHNTKPV